MTEAERTASAPPPEGRVSVKKPRGNLDPPRGGPRSRRPGPDGARGPSTPPAGGGPPRSPAVAFRPAPAPSPGSQAHVPGRACQDKAPGAGVRPLSAAVPRFAPATAVTADARGAAVSLGYRRPRTSHAWTSRSPACFARFVRGWVPPSPPAGPGDPSVRPHRGRLSRRLSRIRSTVLRQREHPLGGAARGVEALFPLTDGLLPDTQLPGQGLLGHAQTPPQLPDAPPVPLFVSPLPYRHAWILHVTV